MINILPDDTKVQLRAARSNVLLLRYIFVVILSSAFLGFVIYGSYWLTNQTKDSYQQLIEANDTKAAVYSSTKAQVDSLSASLSEAKGILNQELLYSNALTNFASQMPANTVIDEISLETASFGAAPMTLKIYAKTTNDAVTLRERFQASPFFSNVSFQTISDSSAGLAGYPISATITLTLNKAIAQ